uniref:EF-hand domain-containing protein n=1 Tax=Macrostomum lignano TaxID=282301 RepID=A0A1I8GY77_9PLAT
MSSSEHQHSFLDAFFAIDTDNSEEITVDELRAYMEKNNFEDTFVQKWLAIFDQQHLGRITLENYCDVLGLITKKARAYRSKSVFAVQKRSLPSSVQVIYNDMPPDRQAEAFFIVKESLEESPQPKQLPRMVKQLLDDQFGRLFHVVIVRGQYWNLVSHEPGFCFIFKYQEAVYLLWRTPME